MKKLKKRNKGPATTGHPAQNNGKRKSEDKNCVPGPQIWVPSETGDRGLQTGRQL